MKRKRTLVLISILAVIVLSLSPLFLLKGAEFGGSDDAGSQKVEEIRERRMSRGSRRCWSR